ncbi:MAG TPA: 3-oxo-tetronate kinase [Candidatus Dormibacteraeota bacterium]|jgi:uncharacterized protein YgbK (DUF1537 family)|nr:3-oxo-tetronate kinase [Candidatus Dormibacteraeota bacterium]
MLLGCIADDFTGASDVANMLARGGMRTVQLVGVPAGDPPPCDAAVVALKSRSIPAATAVEQSLAALAWLHLQGCRQVVFKYCSTFDSTPRGNIGPVATALAGELGVRGVVVCPALPENGRTVYEGHLFVGDRLLSESGMEHHPLNPMTDPDIRRWLGLQVTGAIGHVDLVTVRRGPDAIRRALAAIGDAGTTLAVVDAISDEDLTAIGIACREAPLITGGSGVALQLPANLVEMGLLERSSPPFAGARGPAAVLAGSCSPATLRQVSAHAATHPALGVDVDALMTGLLGADELTDSLIAHGDEEPLLYSSASAEKVRAVQERYGGELVAHRLDELFAEVARGLVGARFERLVVAGGETSGAVVAALGVEAMEVGPEIDPGVPALGVLGREAPLALALKSGNFGRDDLFGRAIGVLGGIEK